jgi:chorismate mutase / prephenate dehydratase
MTREGASKKPPSADADDPDSLRRRAEAADRELIRLLNERAVLAAKLETAELEAAQVDSKPDGESRLPPAVDGLLADVQRWNDGPLSTPALQAVYRELAGGWRALAKRRRVAFLGPAYTYSHLATLHRFSHSVDPIPVGSIAAVFEEVVRGQSDFGVVPVENSTDGRIADTLDMFTRLRVRICGEVPLRIHHSLLGRGARADIVEVQSKPQALSQCRNWLARHMPGAQLVEVASTVTAAQTARDRPGIAAIASAQAGAMYGLDVLAENIEDNQSNVTRFFVIGEESAGRTGRDKMSAMFEVPHKPGALADAMNIFKQAKLNLTWIESFPIARPEGGYLFFIELDGHETDAKVKKALAALEKKTLTLEVLGSYPRSEPVG